VHTTEGLLYSSVCLTTQAYRAHKILHYHKAEKCA